MVIKSTFMCSEAPKACLSNDVVPVHNDIDTNWKTVNLPTTKREKLTIDKRRKVRACKCVE